MRKIRFEKGKIYHIFSRGVEKRDIFLSDEDRWRFIQGLFLFNDETSSESLLWRLERDQGLATFRTIKEFIKENRWERKPLIRIMADCLMPNHYHLLVEEIQERGISRFMHKQGTGFVGYINKKYGRTGRLFQGPFKAVSVENDAQLKYLLIYINVINPGQLIEPKLKEEGVKDLEKIMEFAENYPWSTHQEYLGKRNSFIIDKGILEEFFPDPASYKKFTREILEGKLRVKDIDRLLLE